MEEGGFPTSSACESSSGISLPRTTPTLEWASGPAFSLHGSYRAPLSPSHALSSYFWSHLSQNPTCLRRLAQISGNKALSGNGSKMARSPSRSQWAVLASSSEFPPLSNLALQEISAVTDICKQAW